MALYEYICDSCKPPLVVEVITKIASEEKVYCPLCSGEMEKVISKSSFSLKGTGWSSDGYASKK